MENTLIDSSSGDIIIQEKAIRISDEKLSSMLLKTYEQAREDAGKFKLYKYYGVFLSIAFTLFITLLTTSFNDFLGIAGEVISLIFWVVFALSLASGTVLAVICASNMRNNQNSERDMAIEKVLNNINIKR